MFDSKTIIDKLGAQVRVDFVKEAKCSPVFGNLYTCDPESHSLVIATFETNVQKEPTNIILIPGTSVQHLEFLEIGEEQNSDNITTNNETNNFMGLNENTEEFRTGMNNLFLPSIAETVDDCSEQMAIGELDMNDEGNRENERTISEKIKIFEDFIQGKKKRLIDALKKNGIKFKEEGEEAEKNYLKDGKNGSTEWLSKNLIKSKRKKGTVTIGSGVNCITISPPYEKENLMGTSSSVKRLMLALVTERVFDDLNQKDHFIGS